MVAVGDRWPPVYDAEDLIREIKLLTGRADLAQVFYEWRRDRSTQEVADVCQGDIVELASDVPLITADGEPSTMDHPSATWLVVGNSCDFVRSADDARWTQMVPVVELAADTASSSVIDALRRYTQARVFYVPSWSAGSEPRTYFADLLRPVAVDKEAFQGAGKARVGARMSRAAWILLNACLVRFLARDDGRYDE